MIQNPSAWTLVDQTESGVRAGLRFGDRGTHTSRTMMLAELTELLAVTPVGARREDYAAAIVDDNALGKQTAATRRLTDQRLGGENVLDLDQVAGARHCGGPCDHPGDAESAARGSGVPGGAAFRSAAGGRRLRPDVEPRRCP